MIELIDAQAQEAVIKVIGVGGCGGGSIENDALLESPYTQAT